MDVISEDDSSSSDESSSTDLEDAFQDRDSLSGLSETSMSLDMHDNAEAEFQTEVKQSLDRAFAEGHSVDNAAVELKTLRMASNVPLRRVREGVVSAIVERIPVVEGDMVSQRREIANVVKRWGELIDKIGGVDAVETVSVLQVSSPSLQLV
jgi:translation initiation factor eIF-2B subunit epsilon